MCYTVASNKKIEELRKTFEATHDELWYEEAYAVSGFTHPQLPVLLSDSPQKISLAQWGLIPHWVKSREQAEELWNQTLNAKSETLFEKPSFRSSALTKKCCVLVNGFFEWQTNGKSKTPHFIYMQDQASFALGGLWDEWTDTSSGEIRRTFTIVTTAANELMAKIHNAKQRMPLILKRGTEQEWLRTVDEKVTRELMVPFDTTLMRAHEVSKLVNSRHGNLNVPEVQHAAAPASSQGTLF